MFHGLYLTNQHGIKKTTKKEWESEKKTKEAGMSKRNKPLRLPQTASKRPMTSQHQQHDTAVNRLPGVSSVFAVEKFSVNILCVSACTFADRRHITTVETWKVQMLLFTASPRPSCCLIFIRDIVELYMYLIQNEVVEAGARAQQHVASDDVKLTLPGCLWLLPHTRNGASGILKGKLHSFLWACVQL